MAKMTDREKALVKQLIGNNTAMLNCIATIAKDPARAGAILGGTVELNRSLLGDIRKSDPYFGDDFDVLLKEADTEFKKMFKQNHLPADYMG